MSHFCTNKFNFGLTMPNAKLDCAYNTYYQHLFKQIAFNLIIFFSEYSLFYRSK